MRPGNDREEREERERERRARKIQYLAPGEQAAVRARQRDGDGGAAAQRANHHHVVAVQAACESKI